MTHCNVYVHSNNIYKDTHLYTYIYIIFSFTYESLMPYADDHSRCFVDGIYIFTLAIYIYIYIFKYIYTTFTWGETIIYIYRASRLHPNDVFQVYI